MRHIHCLRIQHWSWATEPQKIGPSLIWNSVVHSGQSSGVRVANPCDGNLSYRKDKGRAAQRYLSKNRQCYKLASKTGAGFLAKTPKRLLPVCPVRSTKMSIPSSESLESIYITQSSICCFSNFTRRKQSVGSKHQKSSLRPETNEENFGPKLARRLHKRLCRNLSHTCHAIGQLSREVTTCLVTKRFQSHRHTRKFSWKSMRSQPHHPHGHRWCATEAPILWTAWSCHPPPLRRCNLENARLSLNDARGCWCVHERHSQENSWVCRMLQQQRLDRDTWEPNG